MSSIVLRRRLLVCVTGSAAAAAHSWSSCSKAIGIGSNGSDAFSIDAPSRYDLQTYSGRAKHFLDTLGDLSTLFVSAAAVSEYKEMLRHFERIGRPPVGMCDEDMWRARKVVEATCHPESGEMIAAPLRFSAFAPSNLIICAGMLRPNPTLMQSAWWQFVNQSYNAGVNYANRASGGGDSGRGDSSELGDGGGGSFASAYLAATSSAVCLCVGLQEAAQRVSGGSARVASLVRLTVPMIAVSVSANVNLLLVRRHELSEGIPVVTSDGEPLGLSVTAAKRGLLECAATRVLWTFLLLTATPLCVSAAFASLPHRLASSKSRQGIMVRAALELGMSFVVIWLSVPLSIAAFPQRESMPIQELEETVQQRWRELVKGRYVHSDHAEVDVHVHAMQAPESEARGHGVFEGRAYFNRGL